MNILLIGGCGYIGGALYHHFRDKHNVRSCDLNLFGCNNNLNWSSNYNSLKKCDIQFFDVIILTAAHSSVPMCNEDHAGALQNNVYNFLNFVQMLDKKQKFIYAGSSCVYVKSDINGSVETDGLNPNDMLSFSKTVIDQYMQAFDPCEYYGLRFGSVNGWSENFRTDLMVNAMTTSALKNREVLVSNGDSYRPILGIKDLINAVETIIDSKEDLRGVYNIASFNAKIRSVGHTVGNLLNCTVSEISGSPSYDFCINTNKFQKTYGFAFKETLESIVESIAEKKDVIFDRCFPSRKASEIYGKI